MPSFKEENDINISVLDNGFTVVTNRISGMYTACLGLWVAAGSRNEKKEEHGLSHLIEHMAFKGTGRRSAQKIAEEIENVGGEINAATSIEFTNYTTRVLKESVPLALDVLADIVTDSVFDPSELEREISVILQEYASVEDSPDDLIYDIFLERAFPEQSIGRPILGNPETLTGISRQAIFAYLEREYIPNRMVLAAGGHVRHEEVVELAEKLFGQMPKKPDHHYSKGCYRGGEQRIHRQLEHVNTIIGFPGFSYKDQLNYRAQLFAHIVGGSMSSRLWRKVREERGLAYSIEAFHWPFADCGLFGISAGTDEKDVGEYLDIVLDTVCDATRTINEAELQRVKAQTKVSLLTSLESPHGRVERMARQLLAWGRVVPTHEIIQIIDSINLDMVRSAGETILKGAPTLTAIGPLQEMPDYNEIVAKLGRYL